MHSQSHLTHEIQKLRGLIAADERSLRLLTSHPETAQSRADHKSLKWALAFRRLQLALAKYELVFQRKYHPDQPRVPAGHPDGGQWTSGGSHAGQWTSGGSIDAGTTFEPGDDVIEDASGIEPWSSFANNHRVDGTLASQLIQMRDGSVIKSEFADPLDDAVWDARHTVVTPDESIRTFENLGLTQTVYDGDAQPISKAVWTEDGAEARALAEPAFYGQAAPVIVQGGRLVVQKTIEAALALYTWMSARSGPGQHAVIAARARDYRIEGSSDSPAAIWVGTLTSEEVGDVCNYLSNVQTFMNEAAAQVRTDNEFRGPADFGTKVHKKIADGIRGLGDPNFVAEYSLFKSMEAAKQAERELAKDPNYYGKADTVRYDGLQNKPNISTVCVYDPKTGKEGLTGPRMFELAQTAAKRFPNSHRLIVTEVRESRL